MKEGLISMASANFTTFSNQIDPNSSFYINGNYYLIIIIIILFLIQNYIFLIGPDCQILSVCLKPGDSLEAEPGSMMFMHPDVRTSTQCGNCSRIIAGYLIFLFIN
jgi:uncharacterized protein (AIM24 family)